MSETLTLYDPRTDTSEVGQIVSRQLILNSGEEPEKIIAMFSGQERRLVCKRPQLIKSPPFTPILGGGTEEFAGKLYEIWRRLNEAKLPVAPDAWIADKDSVAWPDLTDGEGYFYDRRDLELMTSHQRGLLPTDPTFLSIGRGNIEDAVSEVIFQAAQQDIVVPIDDPMSLLVHPTGGYKICLLDLGTTWFEHPKAADVNAWSAKRFMRYMDRSIEHLQGVLTGKSITVA